jgi:hypothetical protein
MKRKKVKKNFQSDSKAWIHSRTDIYKLQDPDPK